MLLAIFAVLSILTLIVSLGVNIHFVNLGKARIREAGGEDLPRRIYADFYGWMVLEFVLLLGAVLLISQDLTTPALLSLASYMGISLMMSRKLIPQLQLAQLQAALEGEKASKKN